MGSFGIDAVSSQKTCLRARSFALVRHAWSEGMSYAWRAASTGEVRQWVLMRGEKRRLGSVGVWQRRRMNMRGGESELGGAADDAGPLACVCVAQELAREFVLWSKYLQKQAELVLL